MQHERSRGLRKQTCSKRRDSTSRASKRTDNAQPTNLLPPRKVPHEHSRSARIYGPKQEADNSERHSLADDIRHEPHEQLKHGRADSEKVHEALLADACANRR
ncbi:hypothetical protein RRF57_008725 [Xylaria bambusicola]|uniref:Uncharacterized protein n=1 Tax=Xylaria bambusicola TaxID=326684 RepID=A0AAN7UPU9_9PEZI